jgi:hypothetical protein
MQKNLKPLECCTHALEKARKKIISAREQTESKHIKFGHFVGNIHKRTKQHILFQNDQFAMSKFSKWAF